MRRYKIADTIIEIHDSQENTYPFFEKFLYEGDQETDIIWKVVEEAIGEPAVRNWKDMKAFAVGKDNEYFYEIRYDVGYRHVKSIRMSHDFKDITFYLHKHIWAIHNDNFMDERFREKHTPPETLEDELAFQFREVFFLYIQTVGGISMHSSSIIYKEQGIAFSAVSGTGKSTHTNLWREYYETPILDGDITVCRLIEGQPYIYGLPWAGTSKLMENRRVPLSVVVFIQQSKECTVNKPDMLQVMQRLMIANFTPTWLAEFHKQQIRNLHRIMASNIHFFNLQCDISKLAVETIKREIDKVM